MAEGPTTATRVARTVHIHYNDNAREWTAKVTAVDEGTPKWTVREFVETFLTLAEVIAFIIDLLAGASPTYTADATAIGDIYLLGKNLANTFAPTGP